MSEKKRKSVDSSQQTISKFFKPSEKKTRKKVPVIRVLEDNVLENNNNIETPTNQKTNGLALRVFNTIQNSIKKLQQFDVDSCTQNTEMKIPTRNHIKPMLDSFPPLKTGSIEKIPETGRGRTNIVKSQKISYTPLEQQYVHIKEKHRDVLLFVECGYKYRFFGKDAEIASKELNIYCHMDHNFMTASIPVHRLNVHLSGLVEKGYKVGVVRQTETAALKAAGDNKSAPFTRRLTNVYTKATFVDRQDSDDQVNATTGHYIACFNECETEDERKTLVVLLVNPTTGDIVFDALQIDEMLSSRLDTINRVLNLCEVILKETPYDNSVQTFVQNYLKDCKLNRVEYVSCKTVHSISDLDLRNVCNKKNEFECLLGCVNIMAEYLKQYELDTILLSTKSYRRFAETCVKLDGSTVNNLELFCNTSDNRVKGSIMWIVDHTATIFGKRMLKRWLSEPLLDVSKIKLRLEAVSELKNNFDASCVRAIRKQLHWTLDLERGLTSIFYRKISPDKFIKILEHFETLRTMFLSYRDEATKTFHSKLLLEIYKDIPELISVERFLNELNKNVAGDKSKQNLFKNPNNYPAVLECHRKIENIERDLDNHLKKNIRPCLKNYGVSYKTVSGMEYLIEVKSKEVGCVPMDWIKVAATKQCTRYRTPFLDEKFKELCQVREELVMASEVAWRDFLDEFLHVRSAFRNAVDKVAHFDCLLSLAIVAKQPGYCMPIFEENSGIINIKDGRHPVIHQLLGEDKQYVANDTTISRDQKVMLISGPNMGGKSSYIKQVAVICILAQMGSYVPATSAVMDVVDGVFTRMGGSDDIARGKSTFMLELEEASRIMKQATSKSLVILDELGRGTSTHDGMAIAYASLQYFVQDVKPYTLFVTHYPLLTELEKLSNGYVGNYHMAFIDAKNDGDNLVKNDGDNEAKSSVDENVNHFVANKDDYIDSITFLYTLTNGAAKKSYGLNVARLAGIPRCVLQSASSKARELERQIETRSNGVSTFKSIMTKDITACEVRETLLQLRKLLTSDV